METLAFLVACIEQGRTAIAPAFVDARQRRHLDRLLAMNAMTRVRGTTAICPCCEAHSVRIIEAGQALCTDCGVVALADSDLQRFAPDGAWLRRRLSQALALPPDAAWPIVPGRVWRLGDIGRARARRRILFAEQLGCSDAQRALHAAWPSQVGQAPTILIATTAPGRIFLPGTSVAIVPLTAAFRLHGTGLVAIGSMWDGIIDDEPPSEDVAESGPFAPDFSELCLPGEHTPIALTPSQGAVFKVLWSMGGEPIDGRELLDRAGLAVAKPVDAFPRQKYPEANRAYHALVVSDRRGRYWMTLTGGTHAEDRG